MKTALEVRKAIEKLEAEYQRLIEAERASVIERMREAMNVYRIKAKELAKPREFKEPEKARENISKAMKKARPKGRKGPGRGALPGPRAIRFRGPNGEEWSGWARVPHWIKDHEAKGGSREDFRVKEH